MKNTLYLSIILSLLSTQAVLRAETNTTVP